MFSTHATKVFHTIEGGAVCFQNKNNLEELKELKNFGMKTSEIIDEIGTNAKMNEFSAAMGICNLKIIHKEIEKRHLVVDQYRELLDGVEGIQLNRTQDGVETNYAYFPITIDEEKCGISRDELLRILEENNIMARKYFYPLTNTFECFHGKFNADLTPNAKKISNSVLTLPLYPDLEKEKVTKICGVILSCKKNRGEYGH